MGPEAESAARADLRESIMCLLRAGQLLERARGRGGRSQEIARLSVAARRAEERLLGVREDLVAALRGETTACAPPFDARMPSTEVVDRSFGALALRALSACQEAWIASDQTGAPRVKQAMAWMASAILHGSGRTRAADVPVWVWPKEQERGEDFVEPIELSLEPAHARVIGEE